MQKKNNTSRADSQSIQHGPNLKKISILIGFIVIVGIVFNFFSALPAYYFYYVKCGRQPVIASGFSDRYYLPNETGYGPNMLNNEFFCSPQEAENAGFELSAWSPSHK